MKTFSELQESLLAKRKNQGKLDPEVLKQNPDLDPKKPRDYMKLKRMQNKLGPKIDLALNTEEAIANSLGGGNIAGTVEAGDNPPVKKKRPPIMARGKLPGARTRFKAGADFLANIKKNK